MNEDIFSGFGVEIALGHQEDFLKVKETLTRMGVESRKNKTLFQSCHILHKRGRYAIVHFKELFCLDGKESSTTANDLERRNTIVRLLDEWGLVKIVNADVFNNHASFAPLSQIKIIPFREKGDWNLQPKYNIGKKN
jgi:hypothetical protein